MRTTGSMDRYARSAGGRLSQAGLRLGALAVLVAAACTDAPVAPRVTPAGVRPASNLEAVVSNGGPPLGSYFRIDTVAAVYLSLGQGRSVLVPDWHTYQVCSGGGASLVRTLSAMPGPVVGTLPSAKQHRWMGSFRPVQRQNPPDGAVWFVAGCIRARYGSADVYLASQGTIQGATPWARIETVDAAAYDALPWVSSHAFQRPLPQRALIKKSDSGEIRMVVGPHHSLAIDSSSIYLSHCFSWDDVQTVDQGTFDAYLPTGLLHNGRNACSDGDRVPLADGFDYPVSPYPTATYLTGDVDRYYRSRKFRYYSSSDGGYHSGEDWSGDGYDDCWDAIYAPANGLIVRRQISTATTGWGTALVLEHRLPDGRRTQTILGHQNALVRTNGPVRRGELIGRIGSTGYSFGCHLHWGHRDQGDPNWGNFGVGYSSSTYPYMDAASEFVGRNRVLVQP